MPEINVSFFAIAVAVVVNFIVSFIWYTPLFGRAWKKAVGLENAPEPTGARLALMLGTNALALFLIAFILSNNIAAWTPKTWGSTLPGLSAIAQGLSASLFTWIGFFLPVVANTVVWEGRPLKLLLINGAYYLVVLLIAGQIITHLSR